MRSMKSRFVAILGVVAVGLAALAVFAAFQGRSTLLAERRQSVLSHIDMGQGIIDRYLALESSGKLDRAAAQRRAMDELSTLRWDNGNGYFFVVDSELTMLAHSALPELVGTYVGDLKGPGGKSPYSEMVALDKRDGHGFLDYEWPKPGGKNMLPKIGYVNMTPEWDWHLGTGVYVEDVNKAFHGILMQLGAFAALASLVVLGVLLIAVRGLGRSIGGEPYVAMAMAQRIAVGDLRTHGDEIFREGSVLDTLAGMRMRLADIVGEVRQGTDVVRIGTEQISQGNDDLSQRTQEQASSLEETASAMEELTATVRQSADNAHTADRLARDACDEARQGGDVVSKAMHAMSEIGDSSRRIGDIVGLIDDMAFQTNLLALNAAVEAARAGEQGRGFAVVAAEVRHLSQRSASAAREIKTLIHDSAQKVESGNQLVSQSGKALQDIFASASKVSDIVAEIAAASQEQSAGIEQINKAVMQMDETTQQNAALVEEAAAASRAMSEQADHLAAQVAFFQLLEASSSTSEAGIVQQREGRWRDPGAMGMRGGFASA